MAVKKAMIVFSSLAVLYQYYRDWIEKNGLEKNGLAGVRKIVNVSSESINKASESINKKKVFRTTDVGIISQHLQSDDDVLFLTTYHSVSKVNAAVGEPDMSMDLSVFDEAHNVHTRKRYFLFGVPKPQNLSE